MAAVMLQQFSLSASSLGGQQGLVKQHMGKGDQISGAAVASARRVKLTPPGRRWTTRLTAGRAGVRGVVVTAMSSGNLDRHDGVLSDEDKVHSQSILMSPRVHTIVVLSYKHT